ncbi:hypothetical protein E4T45_02138 [Aureobasidium sp. EXF-8846]|nr:hypothetical protein E4T45_02138 [Aureobasidium sp. EXF-8846]
MVSLRATTLLLSLVSLTIAQSTNGLCSGSAAQTSYTDSCGQQYTIYCSADSSPGAYATNNNVPDFATCMSYCSAAGPNTCTTVTYIGTTCYLKGSFASLVRPSSGNTATIYVPVPAYPAPVTNGQFRSAGCGVPLNSQITAGGASVVFSGNGSDTYVHSYNIHVPSTYDPNKAAPLILVFHGRGDSGGAVERGTGFSLERFNPYGISVYPTAIPDSTGQPTWQGDPSYVGNTTINDMSFVRTLVANISSQFCIDTSRVFAAGFSNGGGFVNVMACDPVMSTMFNAFAPHSGAYYTQTSDSSTVCLPNSILTNDLVHAVCSPARRNPMLEFHGDGDGTIPYFGGGRRGYCLPTIPHWTQDWATRNNLTTDNVTTVTNAGNVTKAEFGSSSGLLGLVTQFRLANWPHQYSLGSSGGYIDAAAFSLNFFYKWTNPAGPSQDYLSSIYASTSTAKAVSCPSTLSITTTTTTYSTTSPSSSSSVAPTITSASPLTTATSTSVSPATSVSAVVASGTVGSTYMGLPVSTNYPVCPDSNGTYYYDSYQNGAVNGLYYFIMCGYDNSAAPNTIFSNVQNFTQCFALCDNFQTCTSFTYHNGQCYIKRIPGSYISSGSDYVQASQVPVRANLVTVTGATTTTTTTTSSSLSSSLSSSASSPVSSTGQIITSASPLTTATSTTASPVTSVSAVVVSGNAGAGASYMGYPVSTNTPSCPASNGTYYHDSYSDGASVNGLYYFIMCGYDISAGQKTNYAGITSFTQCFALCDQYPTCTSFTFTAGNCYIKRIPGSYSYVGGDYVQASQNPVRANVVTVTGATTTSSSGVTGTGTTTGSAALVSQASYSCPANDQQRVVDVNGYIYTLGCADDTSGGGTPYGGSNFNDCFGLCDGVPGCAGWTWVQNCYLKVNQGSQSLVPSQGLTGAVRAITATATTGTTLTTATTSTSLCIVEPEFFIFVVGFEHVSSSASSILSSSAGQCIVVRLVDTKQRSWPSYCLDIVFLLAIQLEFQQPFEFTVIFLVVIGLEQCILNRVIDTEQSGRSSDCLSVFFLLTIEFKFLKCFFYKQQCFKLAFVIIVILSIEQCIFICIIGTEQLRWSNCFLHISSIFAFQLKCFFYKQQRLKLTFVIIVVVGLEQPFVIFQQCDRHIDFIKPDFIDAVFFHTEFNDADILDVNCPVLAFIKPDFFDADFFDTEFIDADILDINCPDLAFIKSEFIDVYNEFGLININFFHVDILDSKSIESDFINFGFCDNQYFNTSLVCTKFVDYNVFDFGFVHSQLFVADFLDIGFIESRFFGYDFFIGSLLLA